MTTTAIHLLSADQLQAEISVELYRLEKLFSQEASLKHLLHKFPENAVPENVLRVACEIYAEQSVGVESLGGVYDAVKKAIITIWHYIVEYATRILGAFFNNNGKIIQLRDTIANRQDNLVNPALAEITLGVDSASASYISQAVSRICDGMGTFPETLWMYYITGSARPQFTYDPAYKGPKAVPNVSIHPTFQGLRMLRLGISDSLEWSELDRTTLQPGRAMTAAEVSKFITDMAANVTALELNFAGGRSGTKNWTKADLIVELNRLMQMNASTRRLSRTTIRLEAEQKEKLGATEGYAAAGNTIGAISFKAYHIAQALSTFMNRELLTIARNAVVTTTSA
jgi:hypothetical protein